MDISLLGDSGIQGTCCADTDIPMYRRTCEFNFLSVRYGDRAQLRECNLNVHVHEITLPCNTKSRGSSLA